MMSSISLKLLSAQEGSHTVGSQLCALHVHNSCLQRFVSLCTLLYMKEELSVVLCEQMCFVALSVVCDQAIPVSYIYAECKRRPNT
jgi:hypothetical protein